MTFFEFSFFNWLYLFISCLILFHWLYIIKLGLEFRKINLDFSNFLNKTGITKQKSFPKVSVIFSARDEELSIRRTLQSLSDQNYKNMEVIMINDRSKDKTALIMEEFSKKYSHFKKIDIKELPKSWLGKTHALYLGAKQAQGEYFLFTDADVWFDPKAIEKALSFLIEKNLDHLTLTPDLKSKSALLSSLKLFFVVVFFLYSRPSKIKDNKSYMGVGAFNLIKKSVYQKIGGHKKLRLEVIDDVGLGRLVFLNRFKSYLASGRDLLNIYWYNSSKEMFKGLEKNVFSIINYSILKFILANFYFFTVFYSPFIFIFFSSSVFLKICFSFNLFLMLAVFFNTAKELRYNPVVSLITPFSFILLHFNFIYSVFKVLILQKIVWRDTSYSLKEIKTYLKDRDYRLE
ncbi:MAG: glycosyltransferase family 2 protein [Bdellovibrionaceae bacterium]|nr:glycosyltransferase family 2 protein [Pseudobdellovibrionaceae bacterium]